MDDLKGYSGSVTFTLTRQGDIGKAVNKAVNYLNVGSASSIAPTAEQLQTFNDRATTFTTMIASLTADNWADVTKLSLSYEKGAADGSQEGSDTE